jgi:hypothetical protein
VLGATKLTESASTRLISASTKPSISTPENVSGEPPRHSPISRTEFGNYLVPGRDDLAGIGAGSFALTGGGVELYDSAGSPGDPGRGGGEGVGGSGIPVTSLYHAVSFCSVNAANSTPKDGFGFDLGTGGQHGHAVKVVSWETANTVNVTLRKGPPGSLANTSLTCSVAPGLRTQCRECDDFCGKP